MKQLYILLIALTVHYRSEAQLYYPPATGTTWETLARESLGWCEDSMQQLYHYPEATNSRAFLILKDGKIVLERYFGTFIQNTPHLWNSAGKTLTEMAVGIARQEGFLSINDTTWQYINRLSCTLDTIETEPGQLTLSLNPSNSETALSGLLANDVVTIYGSQGKQLSTAPVDGVIATSPLTGSIHNLRSSPGLSENAAALVN